jgi:hypothetical protein
MIRNNGFLGLMEIIFVTVRDGYGVRRAWVVITIIALILSLPLLILAGLILLFL